MKKPILLLCTSLLIQTHLHASSYKMDEDFEPVFKRPPSVTSSLTKIATGAAFAFIGDYLYPHEQRDNFSEHLISEGPSVIGHTLIMGGMYDLLHWGYDKFMHTLWRTPAHTKKRQKHPPHVIQEREKDLDQRVDLSWNRISTGFQIGTSLINSAIGTYCYAAPAAQALLGTVEATSSQSVILPVCFSLSCISLYYSARRAKTYLTHKKEMDYEPPLVSSGTSLGLGIIGTYIKDQGQSIAIIGSETIEGCRRLGFIPVEYITNDPNLLGSSAYWKCTKPIGSLAITRTGELLGFYSEFKMVRAFYQMGVNAMDLFRARATITKVDLDDDNLNIPAAAPQASLRRLKSKHTKITPAAITSNDTYDTYSYYGDGPSTSTERYKPESVRIKEKRHGTPWTSNIDEHRPEEQAIYNLEGSPLYQALQQINECRRYNTVKKAYIDTLLKDTCKFIGGCIELGNANGRYIVLIKGDRAVKIFYEEPHGKSSSDYTGYKLKRVLNAMETAYAYRWTEEGVRAYLTSIGQDTFYTIPKQMLHILWAPERL